MTDYPEQMADYFVGDELRVVQILTNLVGNAIKFTEQGRVHLKFQPLEQGVQITVLDTGIGMSVEQVAAVFEPFTQADATISRRFGGTGLGTTIARQLVEAMDGRIAVSSEPGKGSEFRVFLPLPAGRKPEDQHEMELVELPPLKILVADDVEQNLRLLSLVLEGAGHQVVQAGNGAQALELYQSDEYDLVLLDIHMPVVDGLQAAARIRAEEQSLGCMPVPIIALTASVMQEDREAAVRAGMDGFAGKPLNVPALFAEMARVLGLHNVPVRKVAGLQPVAAGLIDWQQALLLWGSREQLQREIQGFVADYASEYPLDTAEPLDVARLQFSVHGIRGASGNLGMKAVAQLAGELEAQLRRGDVAGVGEQVSRLQQLLQDSAAEAGWPARNVAVMPAVLPGDLRTAVQQLQDVLASNQLDDALLARVLAGLDRGPVAAMQLGSELGMAVDNFDFERAVALLEGLDGAWPEAGGFEE
jgi:CheY-like chemotaxis protein